LSRKKKAKALDIETPEWAESLLSEYIRYRGAYGGRASGKSWFFAGLMIERHYLKQPTFSVCIREIQKDLKHSAKRLLEIQIEKFGLGPFFEIQQSQIKTPGGGLIIFQGMQSHNAESIKSLESYDIAWIEEAQTISQRSLDLLRPTLRKDTSEIWATWNPRYETDPIDVFLRSSNTPPDAVVVRCNYDDNNWLPDIMRKEMEYDKRRDPDKYAHVWKGEYLRNSEARVFKNWTIEEFETPDDAIFRLGADWGFANDPTVLIRCYIVGRKIYIDYEAYKIGCEIMDTPDLFRTVPESDRWPIIADNARPETISHMRKNGFPKIYPAIKGKDSVYEGIEWLKTYDIVVHPRCKHMIDELTMYSYKVDKDTDKVLPILEDKDNHCTDCLRYSLEGNRRAEKQTKAKTAVPVPTKSFF
jgi:phage terminase large subunit